MSNTTQPSHKRNASHLADSAVSPTEQDQTPAAKRQKAVKEGAALLRLSNQSSAEVAQLKSALTDLLGRITQ